MINARNTVAAGVNPAEEASEEPYAMLLSGHALASDRPCYSVADILQEKFHQDFQVLIASFATEHEAEVKQFAGLEDIADLQLSSISIKDTIARWNQPLCWTYVTILVTGDFSYQKGNGSAHNSRSTCQIDFGLSYMLNLEPEYYTASDPTIRLADPHMDLFNDSYFVDQIKADAYLLPVVKPEDYSDFIRRYIAFYYPETVLFEEECDPKELARRMDLHVEYLYLGEEEDYGLFALPSSHIYGKDDPDEEWDEFFLDPMTVVINMDRCTSEELVNSTLYHEVIHASIQKAFFHLQNMGHRLHSACAAYSGAMVSRQSAVFMTPMDKCERQARAFAAVMQMPVYDTCSVIESVLRENEGMRSPEVLNKAMNKIAATFKTTKASARIRMIELGYTEAEGIYNYIDEERIPDHSCNGQWNTGYTYCIPRNEVALLYSASTRFSDEINTGRYLYVEGHLCLNFPEYVTQIKEGHALTPYARSHIDECCLPFTVRYCADNGRGYSGFAAKRGVNKRSLYPRFSMEDFSSLKTPEAQALAYAETADKWSEFDANLPNNFCESLKKAMEVTGFTQGSLANELGVDRRLIYTFLQGGTVNAAQVVAMCVVMKIPSDIAHKLLTTSGNGLRLDRKDHKLYQNFLRGIPYITYEQCNMILTMNGEKPLFPKADI